MIDIIISILLESWDVLKDSSGFMILGFSMAGLLKAFVPDDLVARHMGKGAAGVIKASAFGVPIPLCSCGVVPAAAGLRKQGASKGATASFLISTPETGADSIAITYALLDPIMAFLRPLTAFVTAITTGLFVDRMSKDTAEPAEPLESPAPT